VICTVRPIRPESSVVVKAWRLRKMDGTAYVVADKIHGATCDCGDYHYCHEGKDKDQTGCKHVRAIRDLGLIDPDSDDPSTWPVWTDSHAYTTTLR
jgi:hypothetical protein